MSKKISSLLSSLLGSNVAKKAIAKKSAVKPAVSSQQKERSALIDQMVASWGNDVSIRQRYFQLS